MWAGGLKRRAGRAAFMRLLLSERVGAGCELRWPTRGSGGGGGSGRRDRRVVGGLTPRGAWTGRCWDGAGCYFRLCVLRSEAEQGKVHWGRWAQTHGPHAAVSGREGEGAGR
jgi:hypothetical protein